MNAAQLMRRLAAPIGLAAAGLLAACSADGLGPPAVPTLASIAPTVTPAGRGRSTPTPDAAAVPPGTVEARVESVVDGDTIAVTIDGARQRVRLIGIDTPEVREAEECFGPEAWSRTKELLPVGTVIHLEKDVSETDRFSRLLRYVYLPDGRMLNEVLVREGYSPAQAYPPDTKHQERLRAAQRQAQAEKKGLWGRCR